MHGKHVGKRVFDATESKSGSEKHVEKNKFVRPIASSRRKGDKARELTENGERASCFVDECDKSDLYQALATGFVMFRLVGGHGAVGDEQDNQQGRGGR
jgi:hypothetical protein